MKARPRRIENKVAELLSEYLQSRFPGVSKIERIPVLGRTGPDIDPLPVLRVAVDVKSRKANPVGYKLFNRVVGHWGTNHVGVRLQDLDLLFDAGNSLNMLMPMSVIVNGWLVHMDNWCDDNKPLLPALVLHWPGSPVKDSTFVIFEGDRRILSDRARSFG